MTVVTGEQTAAAAWSQGQFKFTLAALFKVFKYFNTENCHFYKSFIENYFCKMEKYCAFIVFELPYVFVNAVYLDLSSAAIGWLFHHQASLSDKATWLL